MKTKFVVALALALCIAIALPVAAIAADFVPSITYKGGPQARTVEVIGVDGQPVEGMEEVESCVVITSIEEAHQKKTDISQEDRDLLIAVYEQLEKGEMTLPIEEAHVIRDLVDISFKYNACRQQEDHGNKPLKLKEEGVTLSLKLDLGIEADANLVVMTYIDEEWTEIESVVNNGDGTVTCVFEDICPVAFAVLG